MGATLSGTSNNLDNKNVKKLITNMLSKERALQEIEDLHKLCLKLSKVEDPEECKEDYSKYIRGVYLLKYTNLKTLFGDDYLHYDGEFTSDLACKYKEPHEGTESWKKYKKNEILMNTNMLNKILGALRICIEKMQENNKDLERKIRYYSSVDENGDERYSVAGGGPSSGDSCFLPVITIAILILLIILVLIVMLVPDFGRDRSDRNYSSQRGNL